MSRNGFFVAIAIAATAAAFFVVVPFAQRYAEQQLGWNSAGQNALGKLAFFPVLFVLLYVLRSLGIQRQNRPPRSD